MLTQFAIGAYTVLVKREDTWIVKTADEKKFVLKNSAAFCDKRVPVFLSQVFHPGLPRCFGQMQNEQNILCYVFEYLPGEILSPGMSDESLLPLLIEWAGILRFLNQGSEASIIHGDLKPDNLIVTASHSAALIDFGSAVIWPHDPLKQRSGTPDYAARRF